jgi:AMIN domain
MTSWSRFGAFLAIGGVLVAPLAAAQNRALVRHVLVRGSGQGLEIEIQTSGRTMPQSRMLSGPDRIVLDFPGALPAADLRPLNVNRGTLKTIRVGLFSINPPVTRVVLDLLAPQPYQIFAIRNAVMLKLSPAPGTGSKISATSLASPSSKAEPVPQRPAIDVTFRHGLLRIYVTRSTLAQVLFEVQRQTGAEIAIPAGAETEEMAAELGPAPPREVLASLLNGSHYNFIFVASGSGHGLQKAILTLR